MEFNRLTTQSKSRKRAKKKEQTEFRIYIKAVSVAKLGHETMECLGKVLN